MRLGFGLTMAFSHGWGKLSGWSQMSGQFPDPLGVSSPVSLAMTIGAEFFCALALAAGLLTRLAAIPPVICMTVAFFVIHGGDPFERREMALVYLTAFATLLCAGPGRISLDHVIAGRYRKAP